LHHQQGGARPRHDLRRFFHRRGLLARYRSGLRLGWGTELLQRGREDGWPGALGRTWPALRPLGLIGIPLRREVRTEEGAQRAVHDGRSGGVPAPPTKLGSIPVRGVSGSCRRSGRPRAWPGRRRRGSGR
jgi:hypothetical protein